MIPERAIERGLMVGADGQMRIADAGLFALAGAMAYDPEASGTLPCWHSGCYRCSCRWWISGGRWQCGDVGVL